MNTNNWAIARFKKVTFKKYNQQKTMKNKYIKKEVSIYNHLLNFGWGTKWD